jgi:hypothetical protein
MLLESSLALYMIASIVAVQLSNPVKNGRK